MTLVCEYIRLNEKVKTTTYTIRQVYTIDIAGRMIFLSNPSVFR